MCGKVREMLERTNPEVFVFYGLDQGLFYGVGDDGIKFPVRDPNGVIHVEGEARILGKDSQIKIYEMVQPVLKMAGNKPLVIVMPYHRWVTGPCCSIAGHAVNTGNVQWMTPLNEKLEEATRNLRSYLFNKGYRNTVVVNPLSTDGGMRLQEAWDDSTTLPSSKYFQRLAASLIANNSSMTSKRRFSLDPNTPIKRSKATPADQRPRGGQPGPLMPTTPGYGGQLGGGQRGQRGRQYGNRGRGNRGWASAYHY